MAEEASLAFPETGLGTFVGGGATFHLPRLVGTARAKELVYTGRVLDGTEAVREGLAVRAVPLAELGLAPTFGKVLRGDFGVIYGDAEGTTNIFRNYWSNQATGLVNDVPGEIMLTPVLWGGITLEVKP